MGKLYEKNAAFLHQRVGEVVSDETGERYEALIVNGCFPAVKSQQTGKTYVVGFEDLVALAVSQGVDVVAEEVA